ncbi:elongator complex protein 6 [Monomorium pharaonis]|uniref:elongator complex protein 6 n=1 Tax=Monomorium pharaonis TaxID=307658 RepID=UPI00063FCF90|nr:elongator complex protein 6 [Monomorium pharaonis]
MTNSMAIVCNILGIDRVTMNNKTILIEEQHGTNANFLINAILSHALKRLNAGICLVHCHNTFGHYHNIGMRLGYNLLNLKEKGQITVVEPMKIIANNITDTCENSTNRTKTIPNVTSKDHVDIARRLFECIEEKYNEVARLTKSVILIIDDINHLLNLGLSVRDIMYFMRYLRSFILSCPLSQLCILAHVYQENWTSNANIIANALKYTAHLCVTTQSFKTGHSIDLSGKLIVCWKTDSIRSKYHWPKEIVHLFKLLDWQVKICAPGAVSILS